MNTLPGLGIPLYKLNGQIEYRLNQENAEKSEENQIQRQDSVEQFYTNAVELRSARQELSGNIEQVNILLNNYLKNDACIHQELMNMISLLNYGINYVDKLYRLTVKLHVFFSNCTRNFSNFKECYSGTLAKYLSKLFMIS